MTLDSFTTRAVVEGPYSAKICGLSHLITQIAQYSFLLPHQTPALIPNILMA
jgi:hypothetical protein